MPPDEATAELTSAPIQSASHFEHAAKGLSLLTALCELAFHHRGLREATLARPEFADQLVDAANLALLAVTGPEADATVTSAARQASVRASLDRAALVPAALRALAFGFTARSGGAAAAAAAGGVLDWQAICEGLLTVSFGGGLLCGSAWLKSCGGEGCGLCDSAHPS